MTIDPDVQLKSSFMGSPVELIQSVVDAEGDIVKAVQCSLPDVQGRDKALEVLCRSANHRAWEFLASKGLDHEFVDYFASKWAPQGVKNDPTDLNANWARNVDALWGV